VRLKCHIFFIQRTYSGDEATRLGENGLVAMNPNCAYVRIFFESVAFLCGKGTQFDSVWQRDTVCGKGTQFDSAAKGHCALICGSCPTYT